MFGRRQRSETNTPARPARRENRKRGAALRVCFQQGPPGDATPSCRPQCSEKRRFAGVPPAFACGKYPTLLSPSTTCGASLKTENPRWNACPNCAPAAGNCLSLLVLFLDFPPKLAKNAVLQPDGKGVAARIQQREAGEEVRSRRRAESAACERRQARGRERLETCETANMGIGESAHGRPARFRPAVCATC